MDFSDVLYLRGNISSITNLVCFLYDVTVECFLYIYFLNDLFLSRIFVTRDL